MIEDLIRYVEQHDAHFGDRIKGADNAMIDRFRGLAGHPLPAAYLEFLSRLGVDDGGLGVAGDACTELEEIVSYYEEELQSGEWEEPADCVVIAVTGTAFDTMYLRYEGDGEPTVAVSWNNGQRHHAATFGGLLFREAFTGVHMPSQPWMATYESERTDRQTGYAEERFDRCGMQVHWFSDSIVVCAEGRDDVTVAATQFGGSACRMRINVAGPDRDIVEAVAKEAVLTIPGVRFHQWFQRGSNSARSLLDTVDELLKRPDLAPGELASCFDAKLEESAGSSAFVTSTGSCGGAVAESLELRQRRGGRDGLLILTVRNSAAVDQSAVIARLGEPDAVRPSDPCSSEHRVDFEYRFPHQKLCICFDADSGRSRYVVIDRIGG